MTSICSGSGECLTQTSEKTYGKAEDYTCEHDCKPIPCCNEIVCGTQLPMWVHGLNHEGICICIHCDMMFGKKLGAAESVDCPVCLETKSGVVMPNCTHAMCVDCFKRCMYGPPDEPEPQFPYSDDTWDEYSAIGRDAHEERTIFLKRYPLISKWDKDWNNWDDRRDEKYEKEESLRHCPYCRA